MKAWGRLILVTAILAVTILINSGCASTGLPRRESEALLPTTDSLQTDNEKVVWAVLSLLEAFVGQSWPSSYH